MNSSSISLRKMTLLRADPGWDQQIAPNEEKLETWSKGIPDGRSETMVKETDQDDVD